MIRRSSISGSPVDGTLCETSWYSQAFCDTPVPLHGSFRDPQFHADLLLVESCEEPHFHYLCLTLIEGLQPPPKRFIQFQYVEL